VDPERWRQIEQLYQAAMELGPAERMPFLDRICPDPSLRREIEEMIQNSGDADILGRPALAGFASTHASGRDSGILPADRILPGQTIQQYRLLERIGSGGMGEVFLAEDTILHRRVALKFLIPREDATLVPDILAEARSAAALDHPYTCKVFATGQSDAGSFIAMEFVDGETLRSRLRSGPLPLQKALPLLIEIAEALAEAHSRNIVHCDIKPANVMITRGGHVKLMDFGLARRIQLPALSPDDATMGPLMGAGAMGTPAYMAPEQARGESPDARTDVFALGIVGFEMLTGIHPFRRNNAAETVSAILFQNTPSLSDYLPSASPVLTHILARMLAKNPSARYASAAELTADLTALRDQADARVHTLPRIAILPFQDLSPQHDQDYFCDGLAEELILRLGQIEQLRVVSRSAAFQFRNSVIGLNDIGKALRANMILEGSVRKAGERLRITVNLVDIESGIPVWSERYDHRLDDIFEVQEDISRSVSEKMQLTFKSDRPETKGETGTSLVQAYEFYLKGRHFWNKRTQENLRLSVGEFEKAIAADPNYARAWAGLADAWVTLCIYGAAGPAEAVPRARNAVERALASAPNLPDAVLARACISAMHDWNWQASDEGFETAIRLNPRSAQARQWFAMNSLAPRRYFDRAHQELRIAADIEPESPAIATSLGVLDFFRGDFDAAIRRFRALLELNSGFYLARYFLGQAYSEEQRHDDAIQELENAVALAQGSAESVAALGYARAAAGRRAEALRVLEQLLERERHAYVSPVLIAQVQAGLGQVDAATRNLERGLEAHAADLIWVGVRPAFRGIREDERVVRIMQRTGLGTAATRAESSA
jgi:serine/threonine protein kinase/Tfp pilus assembly protein PilF